MWAQVGVKLEASSSSTTPTRTARYREDDFQMRTSAWTDDIADPSEITSYFAYFPNIESLHSRLEGQALDELFEKSQQETDAAKRADAVQARSRRSTTRRRRSSPSTRRPIRSRCRKNVKGFVQIPLGNNIFEAAYVEK